MAELVNNLINYWYTGKIGFWELLGKENKIISRSIIVKV